MSKTLRIRIFSFVLAAVLSFFGTAYSISIIAFAADTVKTWNDWDEVGEDAIALKDAYVKYLREVGEGDFIGALGKGVDVPIKWLKLLSDGRLVLSPCDDVIYFLNDGVLQSTRKQGKEADTGLASRLKPVIDGSTGKQLNNYYSDRFMPHANKDQSVFSYQSTSSTSASPYILSSPLSLYNRKNDIYFIIFFQDDNVSSSPFYSKYYCHMHASTLASGGSCMAVDYYSISDGSHHYSSTISWDPSTTPYFALNFDCSASSMEFLRWFRYRDYDSYKSNQYDGWGLVPRGGYTWYFVASDYSTSSAYITDYVRRSSFTPNTNKKDDYGFIISSSPFTLYGNQTSIEYDRIPDDYVITIDGDTIYDYPITDPSTGKSTTINNYITNNYIIAGDDSGGGSGGDTTNNVWNIDFPDFITNITTSIETAITNVFVADVDVINNYNSELQDTFNKKLPFVNDFGDIFKSLFVDIVDNNFVYAGDIKPSYSSPGSESDSRGTAEASGSSGSVREESIIYPKWTIDLSFFGKEMELTILDFSMYAEPLSYVRLIVCVFIYAVYFVNLMKYLPTLIGGVIDMGTGVYSTVNPLKKEKGGD